VQVYCNFDAAASVVDEGGDGSTIHAAAWDCASLKARFSKADSGTYWLQDRRHDGDFAYRGYCDMVGTLAPAYAPCWKVPVLWLHLYYSLTRLLALRQTTEDGGWTLVATLKGRDATLNANAWNVWRHAALVGDASVLSDSNAVGEAYSSVAFTDVMIRSVANPAKNLGWRHPKQFSSLHDVIYKCETVADGTRLFGSFENLDSNSIGNGRPDTRVAQLKACDALAFCLLTAGGLGVICQATTVLVPRRATA
jgi:hypothetical protein